MAQSAKQLLMETRDWLTANPDAWNTEFVAESEEGRAVGINDPTAVKYCPLGYMRKVSGTPWDTPNRSFDKAKRLLSAAASELYDKATFEDVNDNASLGYGAVLTLFDWAIEHA